MRPKKNNFAARLHEVALKKLDTPSYEELQAETGLSVNYLRHLISEKIRELKHKRAESSGA